MRLFGKRSRGKRSRAVERGQALVEFSLVAIVFFMLFFGVFDTARLFESWVTVQHAAREGARYAITGQVNCDGYETGKHRDDCIVEAAYHATTGLTGGGDDATAVDVSYQFWDYPDYVGPRNGRRGSGVRPDRGRGLLRPQADHPNHQLHHFLGADQGKAAHDQRAVRYLSRQRRRLCFGPADAGTHGDTAWRLDSDKHAAGNQHAWTDVHADEYSDAGGNIDADPDGNSGGDIDADADRDLGTNIDIDADPDTDLGAVNADVDTQTVVLRPLALVVQLASPELRRRMRNGSRSTAVFSCASLCGLDCCPGPDYDPVRYAEFSQTGSAS